VLPNQYQEQFRKYLLGESAFPKNCYLNVTVREGEKTNRLTYPPVGEKVGEHHIYRFVIPGFVFVLFIGEKVPEFWKDYCFVHGARKAIWVTPILERELVNEAVSMRRMTLPGAA